MTTVTGLTAERMIEMENATIISGTVAGGDLILHTRDGTTIVAGNVVGPMGPAGAAFIICTSTTRPVLTPGEAGKAIYETDTKLVRVWIGTRWRLQERVICTTSTRPAMTAADEGVQIYETNTDQQYIWNGLTWIAGDSNVNITVYTDAAARAAASPSPANGALSCLTTTPGTLWIFDSGVWNTVGNPPGTMLPFFGSSAPLNHVLMYGQTITNASTLYPILWAVTPAGNKSGTSLIVPDLRGRIPVGKDDMGGTAANRITVDGSAGVTLGAGFGNQNPAAHTHTINDPGHSHSTGETLLNPGAYGQAAGGKALSFATGTATTGIGINPSGTGNSGNVQPSIIMNWILKLL